MYEVRIVTYYGYNGTHEKLEIPVEVGNRAEAIRYALDMAWQTGKCYSVWHDGVVQFNTSPYYGALDLPAGNVVCRNTLNFD